MDCPLRLFYAIFAVCAVALVNGAPPEKIVGGQIAASGEFPYIVSLQGYRGGHFCGGAIISDKHILTAAHCVDDLKTLYDLSRIRVVSGLNNLNIGEGVTYKVVKSAIHPEFIHDVKIGSPNDIAVLTLSSHIDFNSRQNKINLPTSRFLEESPAIIAGWGKTSSNSSGSEVLKKIFIRAKHCSVGGPVHQRVCGVREDGRGACQGDSGGPLVIGDKVVGVVSYGPVPCGAGDSDKYTDVYDYIDFITNQMYDYSSW